MSGESWPNINGHEISFGDIDFRFNEKRYLGIKGINYNHTVDVEAAEGAPDEPLGWPRGIYKGFEGDITMLRKTADQLRADIGDGYMMAVCNAKVNYQPLNGDAVTDHLNGIRITDEDFKSERGAGANYVTIKIKGPKLKPNGIDPVLEPLL
jgi:hypothetical protein